jgi:hypothetical protein
MKTFCTIIATAFAALLLTAMPAHAVAESDLIIEQIASDGFSKIPRVLAQPAGGADGIYFFAGGSKISSFLTVGSGISTSGGVLSAVVVTPTINDNPGRSLVTSTSATGFQISATRMTRGCYEGSILTTSSIGGPATATVFLETADTNSTTPGDWTTKARQVYSNTITLAITLNQAQGNNWTICRDIPAGKFVRLRTGAVSGTASASINTEQQETTF